ncbi:MAG: hypothetical protein GY943_11605 [Chloroflexi bacterium]|nr:hypothetical protein [Chloroflexota bacterium]
MNKQTYKLTGLLILFGLIFGMQTAVLAQDNNTLSLRLRRDFGSSTGTRINGTFSYRISGPDNLTRVEFYMDDQLIGEDTEAPFRLQFKTTSYDIGVHTLSAKGFLSDGTEVSSNQIGREFISGKDSLNTTLLIIVPIIVISLGGRWIASRIANRGQKQAGKPTIDGALGGTICPKCDKPFAIHLWSIRLATVRFDRCPHCGKWSIIHRAHPDLLSASLEAMEAAGQSQNAHANNDESDLRNKLDDSRFDG